MAVMKASYHLLVLFFLLFNFTLAKAQNNVETSPYQPHEEIYNLVYEHVKQKADQNLQEAEIDVRKFSAKLQFPRCKQPLELNDRNPNRYSGRITVGVSCAQPTWQIYIPVSISGKQYAVMTTKGIIKEAVIKSEDVRLELIPYQLLRRGSLVNIETAIGMRAKKNIPPNSLIKIKDLIAPYWVFKNQEINILSRIGTIEVKTKGIALEDGVEGDQVTIQNISSEKQLKGIVIAPNTVVIP